MIVKKVYSQYLQELFVLEMTNFKNGGYFIDIGASDGVWLSNTYLLEKEFHWNGICIEPGPHFQKLQKTRNVELNNSCLSDREKQQVEFYVPDYDSQYSGIITTENSCCKKKPGKKISMLTETLQNVLEKHNSPGFIDYVSLDTEGTELSILHGLDFSKYRIGIFTIEHAFDFQKRKKIKDFLQTKGYQRFISSWIEDWYIPDEEFRSISWYRRILLNFKFLFSGFFRRLSLLFRPVPTKAAKDDTE